MSGTSWIVVLAIAVGVALLRFSFLFGGEGKLDARLPSLPAAGQIVSDSFRLGDRRAVRGARVLRIERSIASFDGGMTADSDIYFSDQTLSLAPGGDYELSLRNLERADLPIQRSCFVKLTRFEPTGHELLGPLTRWLAYAFFLGAAIGVVRMGYASRHRASR